MRLRIAPLLTLLLISIGCISAAQNLRLVKDITSPFTLADGPNAFGAANHHLFFADEPAPGNNYELYISDGTTAGTSLLKDIRVNGGSNPVFFSELNGKAIFFADDSVHGKELWVSDGTAAGTQLLVDASPGKRSAYDFYSNIYYNHAIYNGKLYFVADDSVHGLEVWSTDGTPTGTALLKDINTTGSSYPIGFSLLKGYLYFSVYHNTIAEIWRTDGTTAGTILTTSIVPDQYFSGISHMVSDGQDLVFSVSCCRLAVSDGNLNSYRTIDTQISIDGDFALAGGKVYFSASDLTATQGWELWTTDKTTGGTHIVKDISAPASSYPMHFLPYGQQLVFSADDDIHGRELWISDGTAANTNMIKDVLPGYYGMSQYDPMPVIYKNRIWWDEGYLMSSDGTTAGTGTLRTPPTTALPTGRSSYGLTVMDTTLFLAGNFDNLGWELYRFDTSCAPTPASFSYTRSDSSLFSFSYTGSTMLDSLVWDFGDGSRSSAFNTQHRFGNGIAQTVCVTIYNSCGSQQYCQTVYTSLSIRGNNMLSGVIVSPNPMHDALYLSGARGMRATINNAMGQQLRTVYVTTDKAALAIADLPAGVYFLELRDEAGDRSVRRLLKN